MWYKISQLNSFEYVGSDANLGSGEHIHNTRVRNTENQYLPPTISTNTGLQANDIKSKENTPIREKCPVCKEEIVSTELQPGRTGNDGYMVFRCNNCGTTNDPYKRNVYKGKNTKNRKRTRRRRSFSDNQKMVLAATPANPTTDYNNPMNTPSGRLDLTDDQRIIPWERIEEGFKTEFDDVKQKNRKDYMYFKVKDGKGKNKWVRIKKRDQFGNAVQPSNVFTNKGRMRKQRRYNPEKPKGGQSAGSWPHMRNPGTEGWYQSHWDYNQDADMKARVMSWDDYVRERSVSPGYSSLVKPW